MSKAKHHPRDTPTSTASRSTFVSPPLLVSGQDTGGGCEEGSAPMTRCVIYARVSTAEQRDEGYSIAAQLKADQDYCAREGLTVVHVFQEAESASKTGRTEFGHMLGLFQADADVRTVVVHKLDRLTRNAEDLLALDAMGVRIISVSEGLTDSPSGILTRDILAALAKHYSVNLKHEVVKGQREKAMQGGWLTKAPVGYLNDKATRTIVVDPAMAPLVKDAFRLYSSGLVSLDDLAKRMYARGLRLRKQRSVHRSAIHKMLKNPVYCGKASYHGETYPGIHTPLVSVKLFEQVQAVMAGNRIRQSNSEQKHAYALRDFMTCGDCGCKITAGTHKNKYERKYVYYHCTHGRGDCSQGYVREEVLLDQVEEILSRIAIPDFLVQALLVEARVADELADSDARHQRQKIARALEKNEERKSALIDHLLDGVLDQASYAEKAKELDNERTTLELRSRELQSTASDAFAQVERLALMAAGAELAFKNGSLDERRDVLANVLFNLVLADQNIVSYQYKRPFDVLEMDAKGAFKCEWSG